MQLIDSSDNQFHDGDPSTGVLGTPLAAAWHNAVQGEIAAPILAAGMALDATNNAQLLAAILALIEARSGNYLLDTGVANAYVVAANPAVVAYANGLTVKFRVAHSITAGSTLNAGPGAVPLLRDDGTPTQNGDGPTGSILSATFDSSANAFLINSVVPSQISSQVAAILATTETGKVLWHAGMSPPAGYVAANGALLSRTVYANLFSAITAQPTGTVTSGSNSITGVSTTSSMWVGMPISGPGIPAAATITAFGATTLTLSAAATATNAGAALVVAPFGVGDGSTTFAVPDLRGRFPRGWDNGAGVDPNRVFGSYQADAYASHNHPVSDPLHAHSYSDPGHNHPGGINNGIGVTPSSGSGDASSSQAYTGVAGVGISIQYSATNISIQASGGTETRAKNVALLPCIKY